MPTLVIKLPNGSSTSHQLHEGTNSIGRAPDNAIQIADDSVSSHHAEIVQRNRTWVIRDLNSTNGTRVQDTPTKEQGLIDGDNIQFGAVNAWFSIGPKPVQTISSCENGSNVFDGKNPLTEQITKQGWVAIGSLVLVFAVTAGLYASYFSPQAKVRRMQRQVQIDVTATTSKLRADSKRQQEQIKADLAKHQTEQAHIKAQQEEQRKSEALARQKRKEEEAKSNAQFEQERKQREQKAAADAAEREKRTKELEEARLAERRKKEEDAADAANFPPPCFATFRWDDGFLDVLTKARAIRGVTKIEVHRGWKADLTNTSAIADASKLIAAAMKEEKGDDYVLDTLDVLNRTARVLKCDTPFGKDTYILASTDRVLESCELDVSPVVIGGCPFVLKVSLITQPELAFTKPQSCIYFADKRCAWPLVVKQIELKSNSGAIPAKLGNIYKKAAEKYDTPHFANHYFNKVDAAEDITPGIFEGTADTWDHAKKRFSFNLYCYIDKDLEHPPELRITYESDLVTQALAESFRQRQATLERNKHPVNSGDKSL